MFKTGNVWHTSVRFDDINAAIAAVDCLDDSVCNVAKCETIRTDVYVLDRLSRADEFLHHFQKRFPGSRMRPTRPRRVLGGDLSLTQWRQTCDPRRGGNDCGQGGAVTVHADISVCSM